MNDRPPRQPDAPHAWREALARRFPRWRNAILTFGVLVVGWELAARGLGFPQYVLPAPSRVYLDAVTQAGRILEHTLVTAKIMLAGYGLAIVVSIPLALVIVHSRFIQTTVYPLLVGFQIIPKIAVAPLFIVWFGFGFMPKMMLVTLLSFFPVVISAIAGFRSLDPDVADLARSTGAGGWAMFRKIRLPQSLPSIFTGLKVGAAMAATAAVVAEFVGSDAGLGYLILEYNGLIEIALVFASIIALSAVGLALYYTVELAERLTIPWHVSQQAQQTDVGLS